MFNRNVAFLNFEMDGTPIGLLNEKSGSEEKTMLRRGPAPETIQLAERIRARAKEKGIPYRQAYDELRAERPELFERAARAAVGLKIKPSEIGRGESRRTIYDFETDPAELITVRAKELAASENISYRAALSEVARRDPDLVRRYHRSVLYHEI